ncbi:MAG: fused MFS/spermidine synthase [Planctomycetaceae bacterium]|nr:fused MFS/spermidine synthase [Planctomycetaceae bacterium]
MFALTTFLSAFLLFQVQPLLSKAILPWFGGSPAVWTVCMLFFQVTLFCGYVYAHLVTRYLPKTGQAALHILLLGIAASLGPMTPAASWKPGQADDPTARILMLLAVCVGLPYFLLSATGPLLQAWFSRTKPGVSPYRLYALSNGGSLIALLSYPFAFEPAFDIARQGQLWSWGFIAFAVCCAVCAIANAFSKTAAVVTDELRSEQEAEPAAPARADWLLWIALPMTACVLLIAATNQICQEVAVIPFLWVVPLALYLLSFILTFDSSRWYRRTFLYSGLIVSAAASVWLMLSGGRAPMLQMLAANFAMLFCGCMVCHGELVRMKPHPRYLTSFYLCLSAGGALGGMFVGLLAPRLFSGYFEWHLAILATCTLPLIVFLRDSGSLLYRGRSPWAWTGLLSLFAMLSIGLTMHLRKITEYRADATRNFFGVLKIEVFRDIVKMKHGGVLHGMQWRDPVKRRIGTSYYSEDSGVGLILKQCRPDRPLKVGLVGLGAGTTAVYGREGDHFRFYEINPEVLRLAKRYFTYLSDCPAKVDVVLGDARLQLEQEPPQEYDVLVLDAFSGDGVPVHLLTSEAFDIYRKHLKPDGALVAHVSNRHLDLRPVLQAQAERLDLQASSIVKRHDKTGANDNAWVLLTNNSTLLAHGELTKRQLKDDGRKVLWTDARSDLMAILSKRE